MDVETDSIRLSSSSIGEKSMSEHRPPRTSHSGGEYQGRQDRGYDRSPGSRPSYPPSSYEYRGRGGGGPPRGRGGSSDRGGYRGRVSTYDRGLCLKSHYLCVNFIELFLGCLHNRS